jgi:hypothetical protein
LRQEEDPFSLGVQGHLFKNKTKTKTKTKIPIRPSIVCNPGYVAGSWFKISPAKSYGHPVSKNKNAWWFTSVIPAVQEAELRGSWSENSSR